MKTWTIYACPEHGPEHINEMYGICDCLVGEGNGRPMGYIKSDKWCHREAEWVTVQVVETRREQGATQ